VARFAREARAAVKIKSEHVARVIDVGRLDSGAPYMVMEYLDGADLRAWLRERGPMSAEQAAEFVLQACEAIAEAHALGIVHRDLKPANLFVIKRADGLLSIKVLDFGISKVSASTTSSASLPELDMTSTGAVVGSPLYMSPEQLKSSRGVDARTDIWSLGVILYELVAGRPPFLASSLTELVIDIATGPAAPLRALAPDLPVGFEDVVKRCLMKDREERMGSVGELAVALRDYAPRRARGSVDRVLRTMEASGASVPTSLPSGTIRAAYAETVSVDEAAGTKSSWGQTGTEVKKRRERRKAVAGIVAASVVVCAVAWVMVAKSHGDRAPAPTTAASPSAAPVPAIAPPPSDDSAAPTPPPPVVASAPPAISAAPPPRRGGAGPARPPASAVTPATSAAPSATAAPPAPSCRIVTEYDAEGQPHFKKVCN
jgi:hypothetical protein